MYYIPLLTTVNILFETFIGYINYCIAVYPYYGTHCAVYQYAFYFPTNVVNLFMIKFTIASIFLVVIRGGTPRYRYDYLTKLG